MECINLGFSGSGKGEPEMAMLISTLENIDLIVVDYEANAWQDQILQHTLADFIRILRVRHKSVPILVVSKIRYSYEITDRFRERVRQENIEFQKELVSRLNRKGDRNIYFYDGSDLLGDDFDECTVDGAHPTDLGFYRIADKLAGTVKDLINR